MVEPFLWKKAADISVTSLAKTTSSFLKGLAVTALFCFLIYSAYITLVKPHFNPIPTESYAQVVQAGGQNFNIEHHYTKPDDRLFLGLSLWGWKVGITLVGKQAIVDKIEKK